MECLWDDAGGNITISIHPTKPTQRGESTASTETQSIASQLQTLIAGGEYPFDIPVVAVRDIKDIERFHHVSENRLARALKCMGCIAGGQIIDETGAQVRVWIIDNYDELDGAPKSRLEYVFQRRAD